MGHPSRHIFTDRQPFRPNLPLVCFWTIYAALLLGAALFFSGSASAADPFTPCTAGVTDEAVMLIAALSTLAGFLIGAVLTCARNHPWP